MQRFLISDMDMTLIPFEHHLPLLKLKTFLESLPALSKNTPEEMCRFFQACRENLVAQSRGLKYDLRLVDRIEEMAFRTYDIYGKTGLDMKWSRELWLYASFHVMRKATPAQFAALAANEYWKAIGCFGCLYEDVQEFFDSLWWRNNYWELVVVTSSDLRLRATEDGNRFVYDKEYSYSKKLERIPTLIREISRNNIFIGDPVSKPHPAFWERVATNIGYNPEEDAAVMIGDVPNIDLLGLPAGVAPILIDRDKQTEISDVKEARFLIHSFDALPFILERVEAEAKERR